MNFRKNLFNSFDNPMKTVIQITLVASLVVASLRPGTVTGEPVSVPTGQVPSTAQGAGQAPKLLSGAGRMLRPMENQVVDDVETAQLESIFASAHTNLVAVAPGQDAPARRRAIDNDMRAQLEGFVATHPDSAWTPSTHLFLAKGSQMRSSYLDAMNH